MQSIPASQVGRPRIVGVTGYARAGKDSVAGFAKELFGYEVRAFADDVRRLASSVDPVIGSETRCACGDSCTCGDSCRCGTVVTLVRYNDALARFGYSVAKERYPLLRPTLVALGSGVKTVFGEDAWVDATLPRNYNGPLLLLADVRYPAEERRIRELGGIILGIERPGVGPANEDEAKLIPAIRKDVVIVNAGTLDELKEKVWTHLLSISKAQSS